MFDTILLASLVEHTRQPLRLISMEHRFTRQELYDRVWSKPMSHLVKSAKAERSCGESEASCLPKSWAKRWSFRFARSKSRNGGL
jgi:hypothetical protein